MRVYGSYEQTLVMLKPDSVERKLVGEMIRRYERTQLRVANLLFMKKVDAQLVKEHYGTTMAKLLARKSSSVNSQRVNNDIKKAKRILDWTVKYLGRGPLIVVIFDGKDAVRKAFQLTGSTDPASAAKGTIRGNLGIDSILVADKEDRAVENMVHAAKNIEEAKNEIDIWFSKL